MDHNGNQHAAEVAITDTHYPTEGRVGYPKYEDGTGVVVCPRIVNMEGFHERAPLDSAADAIVTILYKHDPDVLRKFLDIRSIRRFTYLLRDIDLTKSPEQYLLCPFIITREKTLVQAGHSHNLCNPLLSMADLIRLGTDFEILPTYEWKVGKSTNEQQGVAHCELGDQEEEAWGWLISGKKVARNMLIHKKWKHERGHCIEVAFTREDYQEEA
ncbi:uncharacterized protein JN550_008447 [Neoarthrinium moseri]|uniref:uncharacterized protein n=1 Tax=Neoarthrinium moseri TaxID=1658444 RepID=UPI001FDD7E17|nr:uncharacterized protein JN550_008447 [Neoarthrinium moseri]KAI1865399.1 hypothetical protein JN550_008447 [Neoarthrinium moseri]